MSHFNKWDRDALRKKEWNMYGVDGEPPWSVHLADRQGWKAYDAVGDRSISQVLVSHWASAPHTEALSIDGDRLTRSDLNKISERFANCLRAAGVSRGDRVVLSSKASTDYVGLLLAVLRLGAIAVPTNPQYTRPELVRILQLVRPGLSYVADPEVAGWAEKEWPSGKVIQSSSDLPRATERVTLDSADPLDAAMIFSTSGTTGEPKGAVLTHRNVLAGINAIRVAWRWQEQDRLVLPLPLFHVHGLAVGLLGTLLVGGRATIQSAFDPQHLVEAALDDHATMLFGVPTIYERLMSVPNVQALSRLRLCVSGSAPLRIALSDDFRDVTGHELLERYGMTETMLTLSNPYDSARKAGTVGFPLPGVEARIEDVPAVQDAGELLVRGPSVFSGYWERPELSKEIFTEDGWLRTGDLASQDDAGYISIVGRLKELIITGGMNVFPGEVEEALLKHTEVVDIAVVGVPSKKWGEKVVAFVATEEPKVPEAALNAQAASRLAPYKQPKAYLRVDHIPRNAMGKIDRTRLRELYSDLRPEDST